MDEHLKLHVAAALRDGRNLLQRQFARENDAFEPEILHRQHAFEVVRDKLRRGVKLKVWEMLPADPRDADVLHDQRVGPRLVESRQLLDGALDVVFVNDRVEGHVDLFLTFDL